MSLRGAIGAPTRALLFKRTNPWLAGKPTLPLHFRSNSVLNFMNTKPLNFSRTKPALDFISPWWGSLVWWNGMNFFQVQFVMFQWLIGQSYNIIPWLLIMFLVVFLAHYGCRLGDYDRGFLLNTNFNGIKDIKNGEVNYIKHDMTMWRYIIDHWLSKTPEDIEGDKNWQVTGDGSIEPTGELVSPGGQAAFHLLNSTSLRHELIGQTADWNDSWARTSHILLIQPTWLIGQGREVHDRPRTFVGDWTEEYYPWSRSICYPDLPINVVTG